MVDMVAEAAEEVTVIISQEVDLTTTLQHRMATPNSHLNTRPSRMLINTRSTHPLSIPSRVQVVTPNTSSSGLTRDNRNTHTTLASPRSLRRTTTPTTLSTSTSSSLPMLLSSSRSSSHPMALLPSSHTDNHTLLRNSQVVLRNNGAPQRLLNLLRTSLTSNLAAPEVEEDTITRPPELSPWALLSGWVLTMARRGILVLQ